MFHTGIKRIRRIMPKPKGLTCGIPSNWIVYGIGISSVIEAAIFLATFAIIIEKVERGKKPTQSEMWWFTEIHIEKITSYGAIVVYTIRLILAGLLIVGQYLRIAAFLATYFLLALLLIVFTTLIGMEANEHERTRSAGAAIMALAIIHFIFAIIVLKVCKEMRTEQLAMGGNSNPTIIHMPTPGTPPAPTVTSDQRPHQTPPVTRDVPLPSYPPLYASPYNPTANIDDYDINPEPRSYRPQSNITNEYMVQSPNRPIKPFEEDDDVPTIYYAPQQAPPRYSEIDIENTAGRSGLQPKIKKEEYFGFSNA